MGTKTTFTVDTELLDAVAVAREELTAAMKAVAAAGGDFRLKAATERTVAEIRDRLVELGEAIAGQVAQEPSQLSWIVVHFFLEHRDTAARVRERAAYWQSRADETAA